MYQVDHQFTDLEPGSVILWNGQERVIQEIQKNHAVIDGNVVHKRLINNWFESEDCPFEIRG